MFYVIRVICVFFVYLYNSKIYKFRSIFLNHFIEPQPLIYEEFVDSSKKNFLWVSFQNINGLYQKLGHFCPQKTIKHQVSTFLFLVRFIFQNSHCCCFLLYDPIHNIHWEKIFENVISGYIVDFRSLIAFIFRWKWENMFTLITSYTKC